MELGMGEGLSSLYGRQRFKPSSCINLVGCGGGAWIAVFSAMAGTRKLKLYDSDTVELSNLNRLPYSPDDVGKKKTTALREFIQRLRPDCIIEEYPAITDTLQIPMLSEGAIVLAIDSLEARRTIDKEVAEQLNMRCLHVTFETNVYKVSWGLWKSEAKAVELESGYSNPIEQYVTTAATASAYAVALLMESAAGSTGLAPVKQEEDEQKKEK